MNATTRASARQIERPYCLRCYAPLEAFTAARTICPRCEYVNLKVDQKIYWTREPWLCAIERGTKAAIVLVIAWISWKLLFAFQASSGFGSGYAAGLPILLGVYLWDTASKITRSKPYFRASIFWSVILVLLGLLPALGGLFAVAESPGNAGAWLVLGVGLAFLSLAVAIPLSSSAYARWQIRHVLERGAHRS